MLSSEAMPMVLSQLRGMVQHDASTEDIEAHIYKVLEADVQSEALERLADYVKEVIDVGQQSDLPYCEIPSTVISWLKLNLFQRQQALHYCAHWEESEIDYFPEIRMR